MHTNRLAKEKSPYLLQHQHNPVDWYPWGPEAFEKARRERKPIFLSIGYSTCHWCHVMERESFENEEVARRLNAGFVSIKVDREERPDVDHAHMLFVQATTGSGGWPMSVFLTPDLVPFLGGTYFPPEDRWGRPGFTTLLTRIAEAWERDPESLVNRGREILDALREYTRAAPPGDRPPGPECFDAAQGQLAEHFDAEWGGFSGAPKFPQAGPLEFLLRYRTPDAETSAGAREMALFTLDCMAKGGIHDALGGGFHRYSVDRFWHVPHFEKMLYDQAQLAVVYLHAYQLTGEQRYAEMVRGILDYVKRDLADPAGGFYSAEDADSPLPEAPEDPSRRAEGAFYLWTKPEIEAALGGEAGLFCEAYGVEPTGNAPEGSDPHGEFAGKNILIQRRSVEELARQLRRPAGEIAQSLAESRRTLFELRSRRPRPHRDDKIVTAWNGLAISAFAIAAQGLDDEAYLQAAEAAAAFLKNHLWIDGRLRRSYREGAGAVAGFAADYAFVIQGLLDLYEAGGNAAWLEWAAELQAVQDRIFFDTEHGGYWQAEAGDPALLLRMKEETDGAEPSPGSVAALNALRLGAMLDDAALAARAETTFRAYAAPLRRTPLALSQMLVALDFARTPAAQVVLAGGFAATRPLRRELHAGYRPRKVVLFAESGGWLERQRPFLQALRPVDGKPAAYLCEDAACQPPVTTPEALREALAGD